MDSKKVMGLGLVVLCAVFLPVLAARSEEKKAEPKAPATVYYEVVAIMYNDRDKSQEEESGAGIVKEPDKFIHTYAIYINGDKLRRDEFDGEGKDRKLIQTYLYRDGFQYIFHPDSEQKDYYKKKEEYVSENNICDGFCYGAGMKWADVFSKYWHKSSQSIPVVTKLPKEKFMGMDCEMYNVEDKLYPVIRFVYYVDSQKIVRKTLYYASHGSDDQPGKVWKMSAQYYVVAYEPGKTFPKETFELPEGYEDSQILYERQQRKMLEDIKKQAQEN